MIRLIVNEYGDAMEKIKRIRTRPLYIRVNSKDDSAVVSDKPITVKALADLVKDEAPTDAHARDWARRYYSQSKVGRR